MLQDLDWILMQKETYPARPSKTLGRQFARLTARELRVSQRVSFASFTEGA